ncbi:MAG TPA: cation-translocating P-type ATPase [Spirochaetota bacterium]|nr:cation-translocating P-type ATPase [Spirochaetota bacterium]HPL15570.1 cation-translocating P-type ATPase [Spirochaetota bacterium]HQF07068.1 cation-translocating P-type ATPase [Spirochaetota bacterium]HQH95805.1 cation-translocating P-type ATPase [Spirochaetota bacterium]HQJ71685.1 cation-translocating P-type ATPase [Spirochaetota bacterium]
MPLSDQEIKQLRGLTEQEVRERIQRDGYNELPSAKKRGIIRIVLGIFTEPMFILLVACGVIYLVLGDLEEAIMLLGFVFVIMGITIYQENKTENALEALKDLSSPRALVIRDGAEQRIAGRDVVLDDLIILREGDRVPADAILLWSMNLTADESLLTGESVAVRKAASEDRDRAVSRPGGDDLPFVYSGTLVVGGQGIARVIGTGLKTELGKIGKALHGIEEEKTILQKETGRLVKTVFIFAAILCCVLILVYGFTRGDWLNGVLSGITLAMAMIPEEFPVVLTIFLALGAWRISKKQVLTRRVAAVETLGAATVLCVDKTGTLTQNRMTIKKLHCGGEFFDIPDCGTAALPEKFHVLVEHGILASKKDPFDPMERALVELGNKTLFDTEHLHAGWSILEEYPLSKELLSISHVYRSPGPGNYVISAKGAPEAIADLCHVDRGALEEIRRNVTAMAEHGLRVLGVAKAISAASELPRNQHDFDFEFIGLIGLADPVRETVPAAIAECHGAGIRVVMITGDYPVTARNIAAQIGLANRDTVVKGPELEAMSAEELRERIQSADIFARVVPEQKLLIVNALKDNGEVVAMTGDGVNDAPALKAAHIGVAMGERGTDVARESSDIVLLKDDFTSIVAAVRLGRRIFDNLKKAMAYIIGVHVPIAGLSLLPVILQWPAILYPVHIVFLELIIDPACSIVFEQENEEDNIMSRPPRKPDEPLFGKRLLVLSLLQGVFSLAAITILYKLALHLGQSEAEARTLAFMALIVSNLTMIMANRSWSKIIISSLLVPNRALAWVVAGATTFLGIVIYVPFLRDIFHFAPLHPLDIAIALGSGIVSIAWFEAVKYIAFRKHVELLKD